MPISLLVRLPYMSTLAQRIKEALEDAGKIPADLARACQITPTSVSNWMTGETKSLKSGTAMRAAEFLGVSQMWLAEGRGPKRPQDAKVSAPGADRGEALPIPSDDDYALIPQYSARAACGPAYHNGHVEVRGGLAFKRDWLARMGLRPENLSVIAANGESMAPTIHDGEVLLIDHSDTEPQDGKVFALARGDEMVVKRLVRDFMGGWVVRSDNSDKARFGDFHVSDSAIRIVGRVVWRGGGL